MTILADTDSDNLAIYFEQLRLLKPEERMRMAFDLSEQGRRIATDGVRARHPDYTEEMVRLALIRIVHGEELFRRFFPGQKVMP